MADAAIITKQNAYRKIQQASVPATYAAANAIVTSTRPATNLVWDWQAATGNGSPSLLHLFPFSSINNGTSVGMRLLGWRAYADTNGTDTWWMPTVLQTFTLVYTSGTVPSASIDGATRYFFNGITGSAVAAAPTPNFFSPAGIAAAQVEPCSVLLDPIGCQLVTVQFQSSGTPTMGVWSANV
jgi:hypothetical protein